MVLYQVRPGWSSVLSGPVRGHGVVNDVPADKRHHAAEGPVEHRDVRVKARLEPPRSVVDAEDRRLLGFHIIGPYAPILIQEVINDMATGANSRGITEGLHIHPALPELVQRTLENLEEPN